jgi:hypothetical protein
MQSAARAFVTAGTTEWSPYIASPVESAAMTFTPREVLVGVERLLQLTHGAGLAHRQPAVDRAVVRGD